MLGTLLGMATRRFLGLAIVGALVLGVVAGPGPAQRGTFPGRNGTPARTPQQAGNLLANPGAEDGEGAPDASARPAVPGWQTTSTFTAVNYGSPDSPTTAQSARLGGGTNFFAGGPGGALATASQTADVSAQAAAIDAGRVGATLSGWLGGFASQEDSATVAAVFQSGSGAALARATIGPVTATERNNQTSLLSRTTTTLVPAGTRRIQVVLTAKREAGSYNDGYLDNIVLALGPPPLPVAGVSVNVAPAGGVVLVRLRGSTRFVNLTSLRNVPVGSEFDVRRGQVRLVSAAGGRQTQTGTFYQGRAVVRQVRARLPVTTLELSGPLACPKRKTSAAGATKPPRVRRLWGNAKGRFRTRGKYASATVRGTVWLTEDRCDGTLVRVRSGRVEVTDQVANRRVVIRSGQSYLARRR